MSNKKIPVEALMILHNHLLSLSARHPDRLTLQHEFATSFDVSIATVRRALRTLNKPTLAKRADFNRPRTMSFADMQHYCELIAALKVGTTNKKGRHLSTPRTIDILENHGVEIEGKKTIVPKGMLTKSTVNRFLKRYGFSPKGLLVEPVVVHFQAEKSNACWQLDFTFSELKKLTTSSGISTKKLLLASVVDDRSGTCYQEYFLSDGENVLMALRFLFNAMFAKKQKSFPFQGVPEMLYMDNGPVAKSLIFNHVMALLGVRIVTHMPRDSDGRRTTARAKGKVERPFRTIQDGFETLYHFHQPENLEEANEWLWNFIDHYNAQPHRTEKCSRLDDWKNNLPSEGYRKMCNWDRFCKMARDPCERHVGSDARISLDGVRYQLEGEMAGETVTVLISLFDREIYVRFQGEEKGPFHPAAGPIPLHEYRQFKKTNHEKRVDDVSDLAKKITIPRSVLTGNISDKQNVLLQNNTLFDTTVDIPFIPFGHADCPTTRTFKNNLEAKLAIASHLGRPLSLLTEAQRAQLEQFMKETLHRADLINKVDTYFKIKLQTAGE